MNLKLSFYILISEKRYVGNLNVVQTCQCTFLPQRLCSKHIGNYNRKLMNKAAFIPICDPAPPNEG